MMKPVVITVGGSELTTWFEMTLSRSKENMTGQLSCSIFGGDISSGPMMRAAKAGAEIQVYIGGQLAFDGSVDARTGSGTQKGKQGAEHGEKGSPKHGGGKGQEGKSEVSATIGPNEYTIKLSARGKTKDLIDASHQHPTTNMMQPTTKEVVNKLVEPFKVQVEWLGEEIKLDKARFRDGAVVFDELQRVALENCYFMYETRDGKLRVTDGVGPSTTGGGDPLILGLNILTFSAEQSEDKQKSKVKVKGQRTKKNIRGEKAVLKTFKEVKNKSTKRNTPYTVQHYGDGEDKSLERRARFEANKRNSASKKITIEVFHVQTPSGQPWDVGNTHYVEVPPEGIFDMFECTEVTYHVDATKTLKTKLVLSPPPSGGDGEGGGGGGGGFGLSSINMNIGDARRSQAGVTLIDGQYPDPWTPPQLSQMPVKTLVELAAEAAKNPPEEEEPKQRAPLTLPPWFGDENT